MSTATSQDQREASTTDSDLDHWVCRLDRDLALCGTRVPGDNWVDGPISCVVCVDLEQIDEFCPLGGPCTCIYDEEDA